LYYENIVGLID